MGGAPNANNLSTARGDLLTNHLVRNLSQTATERRDPNVTLKDLDFVSHSSVVHEPSCYGVCASPAIGPCHLRVSKRGEADVRDLVTLAQSYVVGLSRRDHSLLRAQIEADCLWSGMHPLLWPCTVDLFDTRAATHVRPTCALVVDA